MRDHSLLLLRLAVVFQVGLALFLHPTSAVGSVLRDGNLIMLGAALALLFVHAYLRHCANVDRDSMKEIP